MGRPSKLTDSQWLEIERRHLAGESIRALARKFKVSHSTIVEKISDRLTALKTVAKSLADAELAFVALPVSDQVAVRSLTDELKSINTHIASAGKFGSMTAHRLSVLAYMQSVKLDGTASHVENADALKCIMTMTKGANEAAVIGLNLLSTSKDLLPTKAPPPIGEVVMPTDPIEAAKVYKELLG